MRTYQNLLDRIVDQASKRALRRTPSTGPAPQADQFQQTAEAEDQAIVQASAKTQFIIRSNIINLIGNGPKKGHLTRIVTKEEADSDTETCGGDSACMESGVLSKRNTCAMNKYGLKVKTSPAQCQLGCGLFATKVLKVGSEFPVKGPFF